MCLDPILSKSNVLGFKTLVLGQKPKFIISQIQSQYQRFFSFYFIVSEFML